MLKIGFIGFGQGGGLFAESAKEAGFTSVAFNTAKIDLQVLDALDVTERIHLNGFEGAGKDREIGKEAFDKHKEMIHEVIQHRFHDVQVLMPVFALGGGTGSGMAPAVTQLLTHMFQEKVIAPILLFPHDKETIRSQMNTLESFGELTQNEDIGATFIIDNQKAKDLYPSFTMHERYEMVRSSFLKSISTFLSATEEASKISNLDAMDVLTVLSERGCAVFSDIVIEDESTWHEKSHIGERLIHSFDYSIYATSDYRHIAKVAYVGHFPYTHTKSVPIDAWLEGFSTPLEVFYGLYPSVKEHRLATLATGLPFPSQKLKTFETIIEENEQHLLKSLSIAREQQYQSKQSWTNNLKRKRRITL